ncbi:MAG: DivIVA domain-containing protein [Clostridiales bacterium]|jgi:cell division septum initiation protein DivIVA|nr:DivIVA domain-containing protein [Clostridiales bacterium]
MAGFSVVKKGYDAAEVDEYIAKNNAYLEDKLKEQRLRINELKGQNIRLASQIRDMRRREDDVKNALIAANEKSKEIMSAAKLKYALEGQRLRLLQAKWTNYFESGAECGSGDYKLGEAYYIKVETEIREILRHDFGIATEKSAPSVNDEIMSQYKSETKRLFDCGGDGKEDYGELIKRIKKEFGGEFSADLIDELEDIIDGDAEDGFDPDYVRDGREKSFGGVFGGREFSSGGSECAAVERKESGGVNGMRNFTAAGSEYAAVERKESGGANGMRNFTAAGSEYAAVERKENGGINGMRNFTAAGSEYATVNERKADGANGAGNFITYTETEKDRTYEHKADDAQGMRDFTNLAAIKPDKSLEELCRDLGL